MKLVPGYVPAFPAADREPHPHALHRHPRAGRREDSTATISTRSSARPSRSRASIKRISRARPASRPRACRASPISTSKVDREADGPLRPAARETCSMPSRSPSAARTSASPSKAANAFPSRSAIERSERDDIEELGRILIATRAGMTPAQRRDRWRMRMGGSTCHSEHAPNSEAHPTSRSAWSRRSRREIGANEIA